MSLLITGGMGFVLSHVVKLWLEDDPSARVIVVDNARIDWEAKQFLSNVEGRIQHIVADVLNVEAWATEVDQNSITQVIHGAAVSPISTNSASSPDWQDPSRTVRVNVMGTVRVLNWVRQLPNLQRFLYVSSGVYGYGYKGSATDSPESAIGEDAPLEPGAALYDISKATGEQVVRRFSELYNISSVCVRPSAVYGPLDRDTVARRVHPVPYHMAHAAVAGKSFSVNCLRASYDWIYAPDVARAMICLLRASLPDFPTYNIGYGRNSTVKDLVAGVRKVVLEFCVTETDELNADYFQAVDMRGGVWRVRSTDRLEKEFGWYPTPHIEAMADYVNWIKACYKLSGQ
jgi:UDP-glucose 4-epimerase|tara:strand:- start:848 stop:1882 length:1035 start_codon:yes stop_codon:yes gene_type:complete